jgi:hypothetical protein
MTTVDLDFWWLIFPLFGIVMAVCGMAREDAREDLGKALEQLEHKQ